MDVFENKIIEPMLFQEAKVFDSPDYLYELKLDGIRCLAYLDKEETVLINKRGKNLNSTYPELTKLHQEVKERMILDGELIVIKDNKPDFFALQTRSLITDPLKIKIQMKLNPVQYIAFDILYLKDKLLIAYPLIERKRLLNENLKDSKSLTISKYIEREGKAFYKLVKEQGLEGIVAKEKMSKYYPGKRSSVWLKMKVYQDEDLAICAYIPKDKGVISLVLGRYTDNGLQKATTVVSTRNKNEILSFSKKYPGEELFPFSEKAIWMKPYLVGKVQYMMETKRGGLRQPVFLGIQDDKRASDLEV